LEEYTNNYNSAIEDLRTSNTTRHTYEEELKNTKDTKVIEELKTKITTITNTINEQTRIVENYTSSITNITNTITDLESGKTTTTYEEEIRKFEEEVNILIIDSGKKLQELPLIRNETDTYTSNTGTYYNNTTTTGSTVTSSNTHPGVITGITIKGDVGSSTTTTTTTSTSTTTTDISTTIIETQDTATRLREEATKVKNVGETKIEEFTEQITIYKKTVEET
jgi:hypothetical protein